MALGSPGIPALRAAELRAIQLVVNAITERLRNAETEISSNAKKAGQNTLNASQSDSSLAALQAQVNALGKDSGLGAAIGALTTGLLVKTGNSTFAVRQLVAGSGITITNPNGVPGNIVISSTGGAASFRLLTENSEPLITEGNAYLTIEFRSWIPGWILSEDGEDILMAEDSDYLTTE